MILKKTRWNLIETDANLALMSETLNLSRPVCACLANRNIRTKNSALKYLNSGKKFLEQTSLLKDVDKAVEIVMEAANARKKIIIYGDYDVDGVTSTVILMKTLKSLGADVDFYIPQREEEGYGLNESAVRKLSAQKCELLFTTDNGIASIDEISLAKELGMKVIVLDHHEPGFYMEDGVKFSYLPPADAVIDPKRHDCPYPFKELCAGGLSYKFAKYLFETQKLPFHLDDELLIFAAIATVCDVVDLIGENRILVKNGLELINSSANSNLGLKTLISLKQLNGKRIGVFELGFILGPCINATGRLKHASSSVELFLVKSKIEAEVLARRLADLNDERKTLTNKSLERITADLENSPEKNDDVLVLFDPAVHESICGIIAGRIRESTGKPCILITRSGEYLKGSGRSIPAYNMFLELYRIKDLFTKFGGHHMAAGLSFKEENLPLLRRNLNENSSLTKNDFIQVYDYDMVLNLNQATYELAAEISALSPFGKGNRCPAFASFRVVADFVEILGENKNTIKFTFILPEENRCLQAICFSKIEKFRQSLSEKTYSSILSGNKNVKLEIDLLYNIEINSYNNNVSVQLKILDFNIL